MSDCGPTASTPRWVKWFGIIVIVLVLLFIILHLTGNNPFSGTSGHTPPIDQGTQQP